MLWGTYLGRWKTWGYSPLGERTLWGVVFCIARCPCLWKDRPSLEKQMQMCVLCASIYIIYVCLYYDYLLYHNMSKFIFVTCIYDASICLLILSIHTFFCLLFCLSKVVGFPNLVNSSQVKPVDMYFFSKKHRKWTVSWALQSCKWSFMQTARFFIWALPVSGDFIAVKTSMSMNSFLLLVA